MFRINMLFYFYEAFRTFIKYDLEKKTVLNIKHLHSHSHLLRITFEKFFLKLAPMG